MRDERWETTCAEAELAMSSRGRAQQAGGGDPSPPSERGPLARTDARTPTGAAQRQALEEPHAAAGCQRARRARAAPEVRSDPERRAAAAGLPFDHLLSASS
eukprot:CAMPEP_0119129130 /NCGR_PEP_ID=MMETSP1310-20130426/7012_1 /TAXON_ID=464262 /ORGANISM="Genus nov. species nov., Strain RCC2339" /LENGTH=101 /DNA_ID=CAMNT_0007119539 /DNA_START=190 /DNA_END=491 /DNA_ORIENTATION=-